MAIPIVAIVGRPNVGKSSLLNTLVGKRISIVDELAGVTRDRISYVLALGEGYIELLDTGGIGIVDRDNLADQVEEQIQVAIESAALILFLVDAREGITPLDKLVAERLRRQQTPVLLVANKVDAPTAHTELGELAGLGFGEPMQVSAVHKLGTEDLLEAIAARLKPAGEPPVEPVMKIAIVGRRNVGKSSFVNALAGGNRVIVSQTPGTTRDSVDVTFVMDGQNMVAIDTAGLRKRTKVADDVEYYSQHRSLRSVRRADVVLLLLDATEPLGVVDKQLGQYIASEFKPTVLVINKWDLARALAEQEQYGTYLSELLPELSYAPIVFTSAITSLGITQAIHTAQALFRQAQVRVSTAGLNQVFEQITQMRPPSSSKSGKPGKIYYATQIDTAPPSIACFVNFVDAFDASYQRFLLNQLRQRLPFAEVPIRLLFRPRRRDDKGPRT